MRILSAAAVLIMVTAGCQTVPPGARPPARGEQLVKVATISPSSARITVDGVEAGKSTNGVFWATLRRDTNHVILVEADGYLPSAQQVRTMPSPHRDGTPTVADLVVGEALLEPDRLHPETLFFQLIPDPDFRRPTPAAAQPPAAPTSPAREGTPAPSSASASAPQVAPAPDRSATANALKADLKAGRIDIDEFDARMRVLYPEALR